VLSSDSLKISFRVNLVWRVRPHRVRQFIEKFSTLSPNDTSDSIVQVSQGLLWPTLAAKSMRGRLAPPLDEREIQIVAA